MAADGIESASEKTQIQHSQPHVMVESPSGHTSWFYPFTCQWFHVLLNSLFKVLCNFPSRYLFAIGLAVIFSLRWSLPPALGCTLKQPDSKMQWFAHASLAASMGLAPTLGVPVKGTWSTRQRAMHQYTNAASPEHVECQDLALGCSLFARRY